eukprot:m.273793 g.273793  ORF g.273793 m.273793 type:complete len:139 (-) comp54823_c0_seq6:80-496(-)
MTRTPQHPPLRPAPRPIRSLLIRISAMPPSVMIKLRGTSQHCTNPQQLSKGSALFTSSLGSSLRICIFTSASWVIGVFAGSVPSERAQDAAYSRIVVDPVSMRTGRSIPKSASLTVRLEPDAKTPLNLRKYLHRELVA